MTQARGDSDQNQDGGSGYGEKWMGSEIKRENQEGVSNDRMQDLGSSQDLELGKGLRFQDFFCQQEQTHLSSIFQGPVWVSLLCKDMVSEDSWFFEQSCSEGEGTSEESEGLSVLIGDNNL